MLFSRQISLYWRFSGGDIIYFIAGDLAGPASRTSVGSTPRSRRKEFLNARYPGRISSSNFALSSTGPSRLVGDIDSVTETMKFAIGGPRKRVRLRQRRLCLCCCQSGWAWESIRLCSCGPVVHRAAVVPVAVEDVLIHSLALLGVELARE